MYMAMRMVQAAPGKLGDLIEAATHVTKMINDKVGSTYGVSVQVGGDPSAIGAASPWETLGAYQAAREAYMADASIMDAMMSISELSLTTQDHIVQVLHPPGERSTFTAMNRARMQMTRVAEAIPFGLEVCELAEAKVGSRTGFATSVTGNRSEVAWFNYHDSLDDFAREQETLEADPEWLDMFKRSGDLYVDGSLEQTLWHRLS